jgi:hypothetical protein
VTEELLAGRVSGLRAGEGLVVVERDIRRSQAEALGRAGERLEALLERLRAADRCLEALAERAPGAPEAAATLSREAAARDRLRAEVIRARHDLVIQREALGLLRHGALDRCYPVPDRVTP